MSGAIVKLIIDGDSSGVIKAAREAEKAVKSIEGAKIGAGTLAAPIQETKELAVGTKALGKALAGLSNVPGLEGFAVMGHNLAAMGAGTKNTITALKELSAASISAFGPMGIAGIMAGGIAGGYMLGKVIDELSYKFLHIDISGLNKIKETTKSIAEEMSALGSKMGAGAQGAATLGIGLTPEEIGAAERKAKLAAESLDLDGKEAEALKQQYYDAALVNKQLEAQNKHLVFRDELTGKWMTAAARNKQTVEESAKAADEERKKIEAITKATDEWRFSIEQIDPALSETDRALTQLLRKSEEMRKMGASEKDISAIENTGMQNIGAKYYLDEARKTFDTVKDQAIKQLDLEKEITNERIDGLKEYRNYLGSVYDYAISRAQAYYNESKKISDMLSHGNEWLAKQTAAKLNPSEQMAKDKEGTQDLISKAWMGRDSEDVNKALAAIESFTEKYKGTKSLFGSSEDFSGLQDEYKDLLWKLGLMKSATDDAGQAWEAAAARQVAAIQNVDEWMVYLQNEVKNLDRLISQTREIKIDTSMAEGKIKQLTAQIQALNAATGASGSGYISSESQYQIEQNIADNIQNGRSPITQAEDSGNGVTMTFVRSR